MIKRLCTISAVCMLAFTLFGCGNQDTKLQDGYYSAVMAEYEHGWKEYLTMDVSGGKIVAVEFNAKNQSGFIKAWDLAYMRKMNSIVGTYPNRYTRTYAADFLFTQGDEEVDIVSGATSSGGNFRKMAEILLQKAEEGDIAPSIVGEESSAAGESR